MEIIHIPKQETTKAKKTKDWQNISEAIILIKHITECTEVFWECVTCNLASISLSTE